MKKYNFDIKKNIVISVLVVLTLALGIGLVSYITKHNNTKDSISLTNGNKKNNIIINAQNDEDGVNGNRDENTNKITPEVKPTKDKTASSNTVTINKENTVTKPEPPEQKPKTTEVTTNKDKVPTYTDKEVKPQINLTPNAGQTNSNGQTYFPGFGFVNDSGANKAQTVNSSGNINKQVGKMD